jgi:hypothetical protein
MYAGRPGFKLMKGNGMGRKREATQQFKALPPAMISFPFSWKKNTRPPPKCLKADVLSEWCDCSEALLLCSCAVPLSWNVARKVWNERDARRLIFLEIRNVGQCRDRDELALVQASE